MVSEFVGIGLPAISRLSLTKSRGERISIHHLISLLKARLFNRFDGMCLFIIISYILLYITGYQNTKCYHTRILLVYQCTAWCVSASARSHEYWWQIPLQLCSNLFSSSIRSKQSLGSISHVHSYQHRYNPNHIWASCVMCKWTHT